LTGFAWWAGFQIRAVGEKHHRSHPDVLPVDNVGLLIDGEVFHPGDALTVVDVATLLVPGQAPWMTVPDLIGYLRRMAPRRAYAVHDGLLNDWGLQVLDGVLRSEAERSEAEHSTAASRRDCSALALDTLIWADPEGRPGVSPELRPLPFGDNLDGAVGHLDGRLVVDC